MPSRPIGKKHDTGTHGEHPAEFAKREAHEVAKGANRGRTSSPVDAQRVNAPKRLDNARTYRHQQRG